MKKTQIILNMFIALIANMFVLLVSLVIPKSNKIAIIGGWFGKRFADNSKHLYLHLNDDLKNFGFDKVIWITNSKEIKEELSDNGYEAYEKWSFYSVWYHLRAKYHFIDQSVKDINSIFSVRSKRFNLWHGFPLKKIGKFKKEMPIKKETRFIFFLRKVTSYGFWRDQYILSTSEFSADILQQAFSVKKEKVIISGYPRNYEPIANIPKVYVPNSEREFYHQIEEYREQGYRIIGYFPTFRDYTETLLFGTNSIDEIVQFLDFCEDKKIKFVGKLHFVGESDNFERATSHEAFVNLPSESDVYTFLDQLNILMTDYSSIYFDYLLWNRPILFFPYDLEYYKDEDRGLIFDYEEFTPGPKSYTIDGLKEFLSANFDEIVEQYENTFRLKADFLKEKIFGDYEKMGINHLIEQIRNNSTKEKK